MTLASKITILRILLLPVVLYLLLEQKFSLATSIYIFMILNDLLDGFIARFFSQKSPLGAFLDPLADKLLIISVLFTLLHLKKIPVTVFTLLISRDILIILGWFIIYLLLGTTQIHPRILGKITIVLETITIGAVIYGFSPGQLVWTIIISISWLSALDYIISHSKLFN